VKHRATVIQTQTPINPGHSGGPLLEDSGMLVGNFAVSAKDVRESIAAPVVRQCPKKMVTRAPYLKGGTRKIPHSCAASRLNAMIEQTS
jgi:S1-C subfamily serine protease